MIQVTPQMRILVAVEAVDFRKGIDGLAGVCRKELKADPFSGAVFVFRNRRKTAIKVLVYDGQGFWLCQKRLSKGRFEWWVKETKDGVSKIDAYRVQQILWNTEPGEISWWKPILPG